MRTDAVILMTRRLLLSLLSMLAGALCLATTASARGIEPRGGALLSGAIGFPRPQGMTVRTDRADGSPLTVTLGFDGRCKGGGLGEVWLAYVPARPTVRVKQGRFARILTGTVSDLGGVRGRTAAIRWRLRGRFLDPDTAIATVTGHADVRVGGKRISRCAIAKPARVRLVP